MAEQAWYAVVRFVEDLVRQEPRNVGVLVAGRGTVLLSFEAREDLVEYQAMIARFQELLDEIVSRGLKAESEPVEILRDLTTRRFSHFNLTEPRGVAINETPDELLERLVDSLVRDQSAHLAV